MALKTLWQRLTSPKASKLPPNQIVTSDTQKLKQDLSKMSQQIPVCVLCSEPVWMEKENFCFISRLDHLEDGSQGKLPMMYTEVYHPDCFISTAGKDVYDRLAPSLPKPKNTTTCQSCGTQINSGPNKTYIFCSPCSKKIAAQKPLGSGRNTCVKCHYNSAVGNTPYCKQCYEHWFADPT